jgi:LDH2 family malate/lactate/ureidoglycolate dehydrogenase
MSTHSAAAPETRFSADSLRQQTAAILGAWGMAPSAAEITAELMVETDLLGIDSHGVSMLPLYETALQRGRLRPGALPQLLRDAPATALLDGGAGLGHPVAAQAMQLAIAKARVSGVALVGVRNSHHFGAAGVYARMASRQGLLGFVTSSAPGIFMVPTRAAEPVLGTNPIAFAAPVAPDSRNTALVLDMATTTVAANRVRVRALREQRVPAGWVIDDGGEPVTDPQASVQQLYERKGGGLTPLGGSGELGSHKGYGLALLAQVLGATLNGGAFAALHDRSHGPEDPANVGHSFIAIDPLFFRPASEFEADLDSMIDLLHGTRAVDPTLPVLVPSDPEEAARTDRLRHGIALPAALEQQIRAVAARSGVADLLQALHGSPQAVTSR